MLSADVRRGVRFDVPASRAFDGTCGDVPSHTPPRWLSEHLLPNHDAALCCANTTCILFAALRACWSRRSQVGVRARRALGGAQRQAESDAFGAGDAIVATSLRLLLQRGSG